MYNAYECDINYNSCERKKRMIERITLDQKLTEKSSSVESSAGWKYTYFVPRYNKPSDEHKRVDMDIILCFTLHW